MQDPPNKAKTNTAKNPKTGIFKFVTLLTTILVPRVAAQSSYVKLENPYPEITTKSNITINFLKDFITYTPYYSNITLSLEDPSQGSLVSEPVESFWNYQELKFNTTKQKTKLDQILGMGSLNDILMTSYEGLNPKYSPYLSVVGITSNKTCFVTNINNTEDIDTYDPSYAKPEYLIIDSSKSYSVEECATAVTVLPRRSNHYAMAGFFTADSVFTYKIQSRYISKSANKKVHSTEMFSDGAPRDAFKHFKVLKTRNKASYNNGFCSTAGWETWRTR